MFSSTKRFLVHIGVMSIVDFALDMCKLVLRELGVKRFDR